MRVEALLGHVTLQGLPRSGRRKYGVPPGGAFDPKAASSLNVLLGNPPDALCLELALASATFVPDAPVAIVFAGASVTVRVQGGSVSAGRVALITPGNKLEISQPASGVRVWLAVAGGFKGTSGERVKTDDWLEVGNAGAVDIGRVLPTSSPTFGPLPVLAGDERFRGVLDGSYTVSHSSDRIGIRLDGLGRPHQMELPSRPATFGTIQVTPSGQLIILGPDGPTIGGYPQAGTIGSMALGRLAQLRPGDEVTFEVVAEPLFFRR